MTKEKKILIKKGRLIDPANNVDKKADLLIVGENVEKIFERSFIGLIGTNSFHFVMYKQKNYRGKRMGRSLD